MPFGERFGRMVKGAMIGAALSGSGEARAEAPKPETNPTEQAEFVPRIIKAEYRAVKVLNFETLTPETHEGYEAVKLPFATPRYQYVEIAPLGWHKEQTPEGSRFVADCPTGFHEVRDNEGVLTFVQNNPDGSDESQAQVDDDEASKKKNRRG